MHHGGEGERGDEAAQEVLNTHAQDGHTWGSETHTSKIKQKPAQNVYSKFVWKRQKTIGFTVVSAALLTILFYVEVKAGRQSSEKR